MNRAVLVTCAWVACIATIAFFVAGTFQSLWMTFAFSTALIAILACAFGIGIALLAVAVARRQTGGIVLAGTALYVIIFVLTRRPSDWFDGRLPVFYPQEHFVYLATYCFVIVCLAAAYQLSPPNPVRRQLAKDRRSARMVQHQAAQLQDQQRAQQLVEQQGGLTPSPGDAASVTPGAQPTQPPAPAFAPTALPPSPNNGLAVAAIIVVWFSSVAGLICGAIALRQIRLTGQSGRGMALTAVIVGSIATGLSIVLAAVYFVVILSAFSAY